MSLNPNFSFCAADEPEAKFSLNINAFNGNTTIFNRCPAPKPKSLPMPIQPREAPVNVASSPVRSVVIRPF